MWQGAHKARRARRGQQAREPIWGIPVEDTAVSQDIAVSRRLPSLEAALASEYRVSLHALHIPDFAEGVRARIVDEDRAPRWCPPSPEQVTADAVRAWFAPSPHGDLAVPAQNGTP